MGQIHWEIQVFSCGFNGISHESLFTDYLTLTVSTFVYRFLSLFTGKNSVFFVPF